MVNKILKIKTKYQGVTMSNGKVKKFNTNDILDSTKQFYFDNGFAHIFTILCAKCEKAKCKCK